MAHDTDNDIRDETLSKLYRAAHREEPPISVDFSILKAAQQVTKGAVQSHRGPRWKVPFAAAAMLVLGISLVLDVTEEELSVPITTVFDDISENREPNRFMTDEKVMAKTSPLSQERLPPADIKEKEFSSNILDKQLSTKIESRRAEAANSLGTTLQPKPVIGLLSSEAPVKKVHEQASSVASVTQRSSSKTLAEETKALTSGLARPASKTRPMPLGVMKYFNKKLSASYHIPTEALVPKHQQQRMEQGYHSLPYFVRHDFNADRKLDWVGLLADQSERIDLIAIVSANGKFRHEVLDSDVSDDSVNINISIELIKNGITLEIPNSKNVPDNHPAEYRYPAISLTNHDNSKVKTFWYDNGFQSRLAKETKLREE